MHDLTPFNNNSGSLIANHFTELIRYNTRFAQTIEVKVIQRTVSYLILLADSKCWAGYFVRAAHTPRQTTYEYRLATAQVADQLYYFAATQRAADLPAKRFRRLRTLRIKRP